MSKYDYNVLYELTHNSAKSKELLDNCINNDNNASFIKNSLFYGSANDVLVQPSKNSVYNELEETSKIISGYGHNSIVKEILSEQYNWINKNI